MDRGGTGATLLTAQASANPKPSSVGDGLELEVLVENLGYLSTVGLDRAEKLSLTSGVKLGIELTEPEQALMAGEQSTNIGVLDGWGNMQVGGAISSVYPKLSSRGHRNVAKWIIKGKGPVRISWHSDRAGQGSLEGNL